MSYTPRNWTRVKHDFKLKSRVKANFIFNMLFDQGRRALYSVHWSATLFWEGEGPHPKPKSPSL